MSEVKEPIATETTEKPKQVVNPWEVTEVTDYMGLVRDFGSELIKPELLERIAKVTSKEIEFIF